jgi:hypothetical protein
MFDAKTEVYIRTLGGHYHITRNCPMLTGGQYERYGYYPIVFSKMDLKDLSKYAPCPVCMGERRR